MEAEYLTVTQASKHLGMARTTFYKYVDGKVPIYRLGKREKYKKSDLDRYAKENQIWEP